MPQGLSGMPSFVTISSSSLILTTSTLVRSSMVTWRLKGQVYHAFADPTGGRVDRFTLAVGHMDFVTSKMSVDLLRGWKPPLNPTDVVAEIAEYLKQYRVGKVVGDRSPLPG